MIRGTISREHSDAIFTEMFRRVGLDYQKLWDEGFLKQNDWYLQHRWSEQDSDDFRHWLGDFLKEHGYCMKRRKYRGQDHGYYEAGKFIMDYGWTTRISTMEDRL